MRGQLEQAAAAARLVRDRIELEILEAQHPLVALPARASQQRAQAGDSSSRANGLAEIVVRAGLQARHPL